MFSQLFPNPILTAGGKKGKKKAGGTKRRKKSVQSYKTYIYKVLKDNEIIKIEGLGINKEGMSVVDSFMTDIFWRVCSEADRFTRVNNKKTLSDKAVKSAVRMVLPGELRKHAEKQAEAAVTKYKTYDDDNKDRPLKKGQTKQKSVTRSEKAGLKFPVGRIARYMRTNSTVHRLNATAAVFMAAVLQYLCVEILIVAGALCTSEKKKRITPHHLNLAVKGHEFVELGQLLGKVTIAHGGVKSHIHRALYSKSMEARAKKRDITEAKAKAAVKIQAQARRIAAKKVSKAKAKANKPAAAAKKKPRRSKRNSKK